MKKEETTSANQRRPADAGAKLTIAVAKLRQALDLIDESGEDILGAKLQMVIDQIAA